MINQYYEYIRIDMIVKEYRVDFKKSLKASYLYRFWFAKKRVFRLIIFSRPKKRVFMDWFFFWNRHINSKLFRFYQNCISSMVWILNKKKSVFRLIIFFRPKEKCFEKKNSLHLFSSMRNFFVITLFSYLLRFGRL